MNKVFLRRINAAVDIQLYRTLESSAPLVNEERPARRRPSFYRQPILVREVNPISCGWSHPPAEGSAKHFEGRCKGHMSTGPKAAFILRLLKLET